MGRKCHRSGRLMGKTIALLGVLGLLALARAEGEVRYDGYRLYKILPEDEYQLSLLDDLKDDPDYSFWDGKQDVLVPPGKIDAIERFLNRSNTGYRVMMNDIQKFIDNENPLAQLREGFGWTAYYRLDAIYDWMRSLSKQYPKLITPLVGGESYEGREIRGVKLSFADNNPGIFIEGGIHAREWISPAVVTYILNELITSDDTTVRYMAESFDWYFFPVFNPDGYEYTHKRNRLWRKTRKPQSGRCIGADPNRNWGFHWRDGGTSSNPCAETFPGTTAFSEKETKSLSEFIATLKDKLFAYVAFHSYSQLLLIPYGHSNERVSNYDHLLQIGNASIKALSKRYGTKYKVGNIVDIIYVASGGSMDWVRGTLGIPVTYTYELRDTGRYGFLLPANQIIPTGMETMDSLVAMFLEAEKLGYGRASFTF